jgi:hypothetical protein
MKQKKISSLLSVTLAIILGLLPVVLAQFLYPDFIPEETYLHLVFINGLLNGEGFSFTGQITYGSISPLWLIIGSFVSILTDNPEFSLRLLSAIFSFLSVILFLKLADVLKIKSTIKFIAALSFCLNPIFLRWSISGLEATAASAFFLFLLYAYSDRYHIRHPYIYGLLLGSASLLRPEFILFSFIFILYQIILNKHHKIKTTITSITVFIVISAWTLFTYLHFGTIIPNVYKLIAGNGFIETVTDESFRNIKLLLGGNIPEFMLLVVITVAIFILVSKRDQKFIEEFVRLLERLRFYGMMIGLTFFISIYAYLIIKGITITLFTLVFIPLLVLITASLINLLSDYKTKFNISLISVYAVLILLIHSHMTFTIIKPASDIYVKGFQNSYKEVANFIRTDEFKDIKTVALRDAGIVGYFSEARIYDLSGLTNNERFNFNSDYEFIGYKKPDYLVLKNESELSDVLSEEVQTTIIYQRDIPVIEVGENEIQTITLYRIYWE